MDVMDIICLSNYDWPNQSFSFYVSYYYIEKVKASELLWPDNLGYRLFYRKMSGVCGDLSRVADGFSCR